MTRNEIIEATLQAMRSDNGLLASEDSDEGNSDNYEALVVATLIERLPESDIQTCEHFQDLGVSCCETCHVYYAHYDMYLEALPDGSRAWICCSVRRALNGDTPMDEDFLRKLYVEYLREEAAHPSDNA